MNTVSTKGGSTMNKIKTVLVANRGEIAIRVFRACNELGIRTVAIYSKEDTLSLHRNRADEAYLVGEGKGPIDAYLDIEDIMRIAREHDVDAIHPGYGFLSENSQLAKRCAEEGFIFIGPRLEHLVMFGDKINARTQAELAGIPMIPGTVGTVGSVEEVRAFAEKHGFPIIIKMVEGRKTYIDQSLEVAREANAQLAHLKEEGEALVAAANKEQGRILKEAMEERDKIVHEARKQAEIAAQKELDAVKQQIQIEKDEAIRDIRRQVAVLSVDIAEKVLRKNLQDKESQMGMIDRMLDEVLTPNKN